MSDKNPIRLDVDDLQVTSYATGPGTGLEAGGDVLAPIGPGGYCCTGCVSGCGINPTAGYCESGGGDSGVIRCL